MENLHQRLNTGNLYKLSLHREELDEQLLRYSTFRLLFIPLCDHIWENQELVPIRRQLALILPLGIFLESLFRLLLPTVLLL